MNYTEILSEDDIVLLQCQGIILFESNSQQLYEVKLIKKIKDILSQKLEGSIFKLKKILSQAKIKLADFIKYIAQNIKKIKSIKILDIDKLNKEYTISFNNILKKHTTQTNESKKLLASILFENSNQEIAITDERTHESLFKKLGFYVPDSPETKSLVQQIDLDKSGEEIRKVLEKDKEIGFASNLLRKIKKYEKQVKTVMLVVMTTAVIAGTVNKYGAENVNTSESERPPVVFEVDNNTGTVSAISNEGISSDALQSGDLSSGKEIKFDISTFDSENLKEMNNRLGDIVKTVKTGIFFMFSDTYSSAIKNITNRAYEDFVSKKKQSITYKEKVKLGGEELEYTAIIVKSKSDDAIKAFKAEYNNYKSNLEKLIKKYRQEKDIATTNALSVFKIKLMQSYYDFINNKGISGTIVSIEGNALEILKEKVGILPPLFSVNSLHTLSHENGHLLRDGDALTSCIDNLINDFGENLKNNKTEYTSQDLQNMILRQIKIEDHKNNKVNPTDLDTSDIEEISGFIRISVGQLMLYKMLELDEEKGTYKYSGNAKKVGTDGLKSNYANYISRNNEIRQHIKNAFSHFQIISSELELEDVKHLANHLKNSLKITYENNVPDDISYVIACIIKGIIDSEVQEKINNINNFDFLESLSKKNKKILEKTIKIIKVLNEKNKLHNASKFFKKINGIKAVTKSKKFGNYIIDLINSIHDNKMINDAFTVNNVEKDLDHINHDHDHQHEYFNRLKKNIYSKLLKEIKNSYS